MKFERMITGTFISRPNRFIAHVDINGTVEVCHVKNTGRCRELLVPGATVYVQESDNPNRKTKYDLIAVKKGERLINMDSQAPNKVAAEYLHRLFPDLTFLRPETQYGNSRFDFYLERPEEKWFIEVKGVTLERDGIAMFPDAPTLRGVKHIEELTHCLADGYQAMVLFIIKMKGITAFHPNDETHPEFGAALRKARDAGVVIHAVDCLVTPESLNADEPVEIQL